MKKNVHTPSKDKPWFCYDGDEFDYFATEEEALESSKKAIEYFLDETWDECVANVMVGKVTHLATPTNKVSRPNELDEKGLDADGYYWPEHVTHKCDYEPLPLAVITKPFELKRQRVQHANDLIKGIASYGRKFFESNGIVAHMEIDERGKVWFVDDYTRERIYTHYKGHWRHFTHGGTLRNLIEEIRDYISKGEPLHPGYIAPSNFGSQNIWGYAEDEVTKLRAAIANNPIFSSQL